MSLRDEDASCWQCNQLNSRDGGRERGASPVQSRPVQATPGQSRRGPKSSSQPVPEQLEDCWPLAAGPRSSQPAVQSPCYPRQGRAYTGLARRDSEYGPRAERDCRLARNAPVRAALPGVATVTRGARAHRLRLSSLPCCKRRPCRRAAGSARHAGTSHARCHSHPRTRP